MIQDYDEDILNIFKNANDFKLAINAHITDYALKNTQEIIATIFEEMTINALNDISIPNEYDPGSHKSGVDYNIFDQGISSKTFKKKGNILKMSSFRLTKKGNKLEPMFELIDEHSKSYNYYFYLVREIDKAKNETNYKLYIIPKDQLKYDDFIWEEKHNKTTNKHNGYKTTESINESLADNFEINFSQSNQLWIKINTEKINKYLFSTTTLNSDDVGSKRFIFKLTD